MRIVFCDDDPLIPDQLLQYVKNFFRNLSSLEPDYITYSSGDKLIQDQIYADIAFLDVEMPGTSGIHAGAQLKRINPHIKIFIVTAYPDYLDEAMRFQVFRYLSKPIDKTRLFRNLKDAIYLYNIQSQKFQITTHEGVITRCAEEIVCVETSQRKTFVHTIDGCFVSTMNMQYWIDTLILPCFYMTHRSYIINMRFVYSINKDTIQLRFKNNTKDVYLSRRKYSAFKDTYLLYMESIK